LFQELKNLKTNDPQKNDPQKNKSPLQNSDVNYNALESGHYNN
jgi:hypothetical protein